MSTHHDLRSSGQRITTFADLRRWVAADLTRHDVRAGAGGLGRLLRLPPARWQIRLRLTEYVVNRRGPVWRVMGVIARWRLQRAGTKLGFNIPANVIGPGLKLPHWGTIVVSGKCRVGANVTIHPGSCLGEHHGSAPVVGDNVYIGPGAKAFGAIIIGDGARLGANCVATKSVPSATTVVGVPAQALNPR
jgi:serine O-acetyltransferase